MKRDLGQSGQQLSTDHKSCDWTGYVQAGKIASSNCARLWCRRCWRNSVANGQNASLGLSEVEEERVLLDLCESFRLMNVGWSMSACDWLVDIRKVVAEDGCWTDLWEGSFWRTKASCRIFPHSKFCRARLHYGRRRWRRQAKLFSTLYSWEIKRLGWCEEMRLAVSNNSIGLPVCSSRS